MHVKCLCVLSILTVVPFMQINNKNNETTPLNRSDENPENNVNETSGLDEKLSLEKDVEASQTTNKRKGISGAIVTAEEMLENPKNRLIVAIVCGILLFLTILILAIIIIAFSDVCIRNWNPIIPTHTHAFPRRTTTRPTDSFVLYRSLADHTISSTIDMAI